ncbi:MAG: hypothetical protein VYA34_16310, partial [Myxococcota bacterium]|nr:hypothetical protein [Myxococcota bacterium]
MVPPQEKTHPNKTEDSAPPQLYESTLTLLEHLNSLQEPLTNHVDNLSDYLHQIERDPAWKVYVGYRHFKRFFIRGSLREKRQFIRWALGTLWSRLLNRPNNNPFSESFKLPYPSPLLQSLASTLHTNSIPKNPQALRQNLDKLNHGFQNILQHSKQRNTILDSVETAEIYEEIRRVVQDKKVIIF